MSSSTPNVMSPETEVRTFKQRGGESLKDVWYRISDAQHRSTKNIQALFFLEFFMLEPQTRISMCLILYLVETS